MIKYNNIEYNNTDLIDWELAEKIGGFYFSHAKYLGLPKPPAIVVFDQQIEIELLSDEQLKILTNYHELFKKAEAENAKLFNTR